MDETRMQGVFPILVTPFDEQSRVDVDSLQNLVEFELAAGVHGLGIALGSEIVRLSEAERRLVTRTVVDRVRGRVPVVVNSGGAGTELALLYSGMARDDGADALMMMPPSFMPAGAAEVRAYFHAVSDQIELPIFIQDTGTAPVAADLARQIAAESPWVQYIKVESFPTASKVAQAVEQAGSLLTVFGGAGGDYFLEELRRGSVGTMPGCSNPEAFVRVWDLVHQGDRAAAREVFYRRILPLNRLAALGWSGFYHVHKAVLQHRGAIRCPLVRGPVPPLDAAAQQDLAQLIAELY